MEGGAGSMEVGLGWEHGVGAWWWGWDGSIGVGAAVGAWLVGLLSVVCIMDYGDLVSILVQKMFC